MGDQGPGMASTTQLNGKTHALYRFYDVAGDLLYVGITVDPGRRLERHRGDKPWWHEVARVELEQHPTRASVLTAERAAIANEKPRHNIRLNSGALATSIDRDPDEDTHDGLVGRHFHSWREPREDDSDHATIRRGLVLEWQGHVLDRVEVGLYLVELYSWWDGMPNGQQLVPVASMSNWTFYDDAVEMQVALGCREVRDTRQECGGEITHVVFMPYLLGPVLVCSHCVDSYSDKAKQLIWVDGKPKIP